MGMGMGTGIGKPTWPLLNECDNKGESDTAGRQSKHFFRFCLLESNRNCSYCCSGVLLFVDKWESIWEALYGIQHNHSRYANCLLNQWESINYLNTIKTKFHCKSLDKTKAWHCLWLNLYVDICIINRIFAQ